VVLSPAELISIVNMDGAAYAAQSVRANAGARSNGLLTLDARGHCHRPSWARFRVRVRVGLGLTLTPNQTPLQY